MTLLDFGRFDTEEEAVAIANAANVGLAGRRSSLLRGSYNHFFSLCQGLRFICHPGFGLVPRIQVWSLLVGAGGVG